MDRRRKQGTGMEGVPGRKEGKGEAGKGVLVAFGVKGGQNRVGL